MKAVTMAAQAIKAGDADVIVAGGMENMSLVPHYYNARVATKLGDIKMQDGMVLDGLTDVYNKVHMGVCAEKCAVDYTITREDQDNFAIESYNRSAKAWSEGKFNDEIVPVSIPQRKGDPVIFAEDEEYKAVNFDRIRTLPTVFKKEEGTVTAANASTLNDGASALILVSKEKMEEFLNSTFNVSKSGINSEFNAFYKEKENSFIKAVIDENNKGYLGSRIRFRLLEDIYVGNKKLSKGSLLYGQISGFAMQRVNLSIVSVFTKGEIYPVNLSVYDVDGSKGLYVPESIFRDMIREMGSNSVQGTQMDMGGQGFFTSIGSKLFTSTSKSIANLIKTNKAKLKYNSYVFLIDEKQLKDSQNQQKK